MVFSYMKTPSHQEKVDNNLLKLVYTLLVLKGYFCLKFISNCLELGK